MKLLADVGVANSTLQVLRNRGHDVVHLREEGLQRSPDTEILEIARREGRAVVTFDLDFGDLLALSIRDDPSVVILRLRDQTPASVNPRLLQVLEDRGSDLEGGCIVVVEDNRYRLRRLPIQE